MKIQIDAPKSILVTGGGKKEMLTVHERPGHTTVYINPSSLSTMQSCWRKSHYQLDLGLKSKDESPALIFGTAIHAALEVFYLSKPKERVLNSKVEDFFELVTYNAEIEGYEDNVLVDAVRAFVRAAAPLSGIEAHASRSIACGVWTLKHYFRTYVDDTFVAHVDEHGPMIERRVEYIIYQDEFLTIYVHGTIDVIMKDTATSNLAVTDHKTTGRLGMEFYNRLKPNHQYTAYILGAQLCLGIDTNVFVVNGIEVKAMPKTARGTPPKFIRQPTTRTAEDIQEFKDAMIGYVKDYLARKKSGVWELGSVNNCAMYGGCGFLPVCSSPAVLRESIIKNKFVADSYGKRPMEEDEQMELEGVLNE